MSEHTVKGCVHAKVRENYFYNSQYLNIIISSLLHNKLINLNHPFQFF